MLDVIQLLTQREIGEVSPNYFVKHLNSLAFTNIRVSEEVLVSPQQGKIKEIQATTDCLYILYSNGHCSVLSKHSHEQVRMFSFPGQPIRALYINKVNSTLILVTIRGQHNSRLICYSYSLEDLAAQQCLFQDEDIRTPGFIEFDDVNQVILTRSPSSRVYSVWSMKDYSMLYRVSEASIEEVRLTTDVLLNIYSPNGNKLPLKLCSVKDGTLINAFYLQLKPRRCIELIELFNEHLLFKQFFEPLVIYNLLTDTYTKVHNFTSPQAFIFLSQHMKFLVLKPKGLELWNFQGKLLRNFDLEIPFSYSFQMQSMLYITTNQMFLIAGCAATTSNSNSLNTNAASGSLVKVKVLDIQAGQEIYDFEMTRGICTIYWDEFSSELYTGDALGTLTRWTQ